MFVDKEFLKRFVANKTSGVFGKRTKFDLRNTLTNFSTFYR